MGIRTALFIFSVLQIALAAFPNDAGATNRALLIGASGYQAPANALRGPPNDVRVMWGLLTERGFSKANIRVLADGLPEAFAKEAAVDCPKPAKSAGCPLYASIVGALSELVTTAKTGDYIVLYFSGLGVQVPDLVKRTAPDGLRQGFVPLDVGRWQEQQRTVENLLTSDFVGDAIERMRSNGVFVWALFDTGHTSDMVRETANYTMSRNMAGRALGIPESAYAEAREAKPKAGGSSLVPMGSGRINGLVGFYASRSDQIALEFTFQETNAVGEPEALPMGAFTYALRRALGEDPDANYRRLAQGIVDIYATIGANVSIPYFEGDMDKPVFSDRAPEPIWAVRWHAGKLRLAAGEFNGLSEGSVVALLRATGSGSDVPVGYAQVVRVWASSSEAIPITRADKSAAAVPTSNPSRARLEQPGIRASLRIGSPPDRDLALPGAKTAFEAIEALRASQPFSVDWVAAGDPADLYLRIASRQIQVLSRNGAWQYSIDITYADETERSLQEILWRRLRALNLQRVIRAHHLARKFDDGRESLTVELFLYRDPRAGKAGACPDEPSRQEGTLPTAFPTGVRPIGAGMHAELRHCDIVYVLMRNTLGVRIGIDATLLYVDAGGDMQCFNSFGRARVAPGERDRVQGFRIVTTDPTSGAALPSGREQLMIIGIDQTARTAAETTFCHLAQPNLDRARVEKQRLRAKFRDGRVSPFEEFLAKASLAADSSRDFITIEPVELSTVAMWTFGWDVTKAAQ